MRWSTRLRGVGLLMLLACHLVSSYHSQDYQIWDWGDRERKRIEHQPLQRQDWHHNYHQQRNGREYFETSAVDNTLYRGHFDEHLEKDNVKYSDSINDIIAATQSADESYLYNLDDQINAEPSILGTRHPLTVNQHLDANDEDRFNNDEDSDVKSSNTNDDEDEDDENTRSVNVLNVSSKDSPYALINKFFSEREDNYEEKKSAYKNAVESGEIVNNIKDVKPDDVWLSDGGLLVLKGGVSRFSARNGATSDRRKWLDDPWEPLDDYQAPYREPILPPPDFIPNDTGVGVPLPPDDEDNVFNIVNVRKPKKERELEENEIKTLPPTTKKKINEYKYKKKDDTKYVIKKLPPPRIKFDPLLDEQKYIDEMKNFNPERRHISQHELNSPNELLLVKTRPLLVDHPPNPPNLVTVLPYIEPNQPLSSPSPLITPPTEHSQGKVRVTTSTTTIASNTVSSLPRLYKTTPIPTVGSSYPRSSPTKGTGFYVSTSTPSSYSYSFQSSHKSKPLVVKNRARVILPSGKLSQGEDNDSSINDEFNKISHSEQITTPMYTTTSSVSSTSRPYKLIKTTSAPVFQPAPHVTTHKSTPITIAINKEGRSRKENVRSLPITTTKIRIKTPVENKKKETNLYKALTKPRIKNPEEAKYYKGHSVDSINSIYNSVREKDSSSSYSTSFKSDALPPSHLPNSPVNSFPPTDSPLLSISPTPTIRTLPPREPEVVFNKLSKKFAFGSKIFPEENSPQSTHKSLPSLSNEIFSNEISDNEIGTRRRASVVRDNSYYLVNKARGSRKVRKLPNYHFTVGKFPTNPFLALKRKLSARSRKDKKRKRHFLRPWQSNKVPNDSVTVASNAISKLARPSSPSFKRQLPFVKRNLRFQNGSGTKGDEKIYVTRKPRFVSSVRRSGHGYASFFCGGKGCKSWGYTFRA